MGREVRRVPLDFDWPLNKTWHGYLNPHHVVCAWCRGRGHTQDYQRFENFCRNIIIAAEGFAPGASVDWEKHKAGFTSYRDHFSDEIAGHYAKLMSCLPEWPWPEFDPVDVLMEIAGLDRSWLTETEENVIRKLSLIEVPSVFYKPRMVRYDWVEVDGKRQRNAVLDLTGGVYYPHPYLCWDRGIDDVGDKFHELITACGIEFGDLSTNPWPLMRLIMKKVGLPYTTEQRSWGDWDTFEWGYCSWCKGEGRDPRHEEAYKAWEDFEPPEGDAYQIWETTSEGSPITPPFETPEALAQWCVDNRTSTFGDNTMSYDHWLKFIQRPGWAPSAVAIEGVGVMSGVEFTARKAESDEQQGESP